MAFSHSSRRLALLLAGGAAAVSLLGACGSDAPDVPSGTTVPSPGGSSPTGPTTANTVTTAPPASVAGEDSPNTLGSPGSFGEGTDTSGG